MKRSNMPIVILFVVTAMVIGLITRLENHSPETNTDTETTADTDFASAAGSSHLRDNNALYADQDNDSVVTMYLTVSSGNSSESTNHTWAEVNSYSAYDYEEMGVDRYAVEGMLQVGDENGPKAGEFGYSASSPNATVQIRGQSSSRNEQKNYKIRIKDNHGTWNGQQTIDLNKHMSEGLRFRNKLGFDLLSEIDQLMSLRTQFVHLYVKDNTSSGDGEFHDYGLYTQVEQLNKSALRIHGLNPEGYLYKVNFFEFRRYPEVIKLATDPDYDEKAFEQYLEIKGRNDHSKLITMLDALNDYSNDIDDVLEQYFDTENLAYWLAFNILLGNYDTQSRNCYLYSSVNDDRWYILSWDLDAMLMTQEYEIRGRIGGGVSWETGVSNYWGNVLFQRALKSEKFRKELNDAVEDLVRNQLNGKHVAEKAAEYVSVVKPYVFSEPDRTYEGLTPAEYDEVAAGIPSLISGYYEKYIQSLQNPQPFYISTPTVKDGKLEASWDVSYDFQGQDITYTATIAKDPDMKEIVADYSGEWPGMECDLPSAGQYFIKVQSKDSDGNSQDAFDQYNMRDGIRFGTLCFYIHDDGTITLDEAAGS